jgi:oligopeptidase B
VTTSPPAPEQRPHERVFHGDVVGDPYAWLLDKDDPAVVEHLRAETAHAEAATVHLGPLRDRLFEELKGRVQETDLSVPVRKGPWWYYGRTVEGLQYGIQCRVAAAGAELAPPDLAAYGDDPVPGEEVLLDANELAGDSPYLGLGTFDVSPDHAMAALSVDLDGDERYELRFRDLATGADRPERIPGTYYGSAWHVDGSAFCYTTVDDANRPDTLWRHRLGTDPATDEQLWHESDERFYLGVGLTRDERWIVLTLGSVLTSEVHLIDATDPAALPVVVEPRTQGIEYTVETHGEHLLVISNHDHPNAAVYRTTRAEPGRAGWEPVIPGDDATRIEGVDAFAGHVVVSARRDGVQGLQVLPVADASTLALGGGWDVELPEALRSVGLGATPDFAATVVRVGYASFTTPGSVYDLDLTTGALTLRKQTPVLGGYEHDAYDARRVWATAPDGEQVPVSVVGRRDVLDTPGPHPCLLYGYGAYEASMDPWFSHARVSLLDRGVVFAVGHVRGGGELGRRWYEDGKLLAKPNSFSDLVACADALIADGTTTPDRLAIRGGSAGGLLVGAATNLAPDRFRAVLAEVPFVDALNTILDPALPLTVLEWEEWGNPVEDAEVYRTMRGYSPYENVSAVAYPAVLATAGLNDPRVGVHEPTKWVARLRDVTIGEHPVLLKVELGSGHGGPSGRYDAWHDEAWALAWVLEQLGVTDE